MFLLISQPIKQFNSFDMSYIFAESIAFCQAQPKPQLSWAEWLYFQLIQTPPTTHPTGKVYFPAGANF